jgi:hypothetical protein
MRGLAGPLTVVMARARRSRSWVLPVLALAVVFGLAGALASESVIVGDQAARATLRGLAPLDRAIRLIWEGPVTPYAARTANRVLSRLGVRQPTQVLLLNPVRLSETVVHPVAITPLSPWLPASAVHLLGPCRPLDCPVLLDGRGPLPITLAASGVRLRVVGRVNLSPVALGYAPGPHRNPPVLVTGDIAGLSAIGGLNGVYRTYSWVGSLPIARLRSWSLRSLTSRLSSAQTTLSPLSDRFTLESPFFGLASARSRAALATHRLLLVDGGVLVALVLFVLLAAGALQRDQQAEIERLRQAGGRGIHTAVFVLAEAAWMSTVAILAGLGLGILLTIILAAGTNEPVPGVLVHGLLAPPAAAVLAGGWAATTTILAAAPLVRGGRIADLAGLVGAAVLIAGLWLGAGSKSGWIGLLIPLACLSAGLVLFRATGVALGAGERITRRASISLRLALVSLGRARGTAGLAICFLAISTGLAGFGLSFRATLIRGAADRAADRIPLDALVAPGGDFEAPLQLASLARWRALSRGQVFPVRRTQATYPAGGATVSVPALGVPAGALGLIHGWRASDGPGSLTSLARRLRPAEPARSPGPMLPPATRLVALAVRSPAMNLDVGLDLRAPDGSVDRLSLGTTGLRPAVLRARLPPGRWEVEAVELSELAGTAITNGHQNGENPAPATQFSARLRIGPLVARGGDGRTLLRQDLGGWRAVGAASGGHSSNAAVGQAPSLALDFQTTGWPGVVRPSQPSDSRELPILADRGTAAAATPGGRIGLTVDGAPVQARVVGVLRRFPTVGAGGFVVADQALLSGALDAWLPGQGRPDELWISTSRPGALRGALRNISLSALSAVFRGDVERGLRSDPVAGGVMRTLLAAALVAVALGLLGMLLVLAGPLRLRRIQSDLETQGIGPSGLRRELRLRFGIACVLGIWSGLLIALLLDTLTVDAVGAYENGADHPALVTVVPWPQLLGLGAGLTVLCLACGWLVSEAMLPRRPRRNRPRPRLAGPALDELAREPIP